MTDTATPDRDPAIVALHAALDRAEGITLVSQREREVAIVNARSLVTIAERLGEVVELLAVQTFGTPNAALANAISDERAREADGEDDEPMLPTLAAVLPLVDLGTVLTIRDSDESEVELAVTAEGTSEGAAWVELTPWKGSTMEGAPLRAWREGADYADSVVVLTIDGLPAREVLVQASRDAMDEAAVIPEEALIPEARLAEPEPIQAEHAHVDLDEDDEVEPFDTSTLVDVEPPVADHRGSFFDDSESGPDDE